MCEWGNTTPVLVPIPSDLSFNGRFRWAIKLVDSCLAEIISDFNVMGIYTSGCCCGHGRGPMEIMFHMRED